MSEYYIWQTKEQADAALQNINGHQSFPIQGRNAATGELVNNWTTCWCANSVEFLDGKWGFPRIPSVFLDAMGIDEQQRNAWLVAFNPEISSNAVLKIIEEEP